MKAMTTACRSHRYRSRNISLVAYGVGREIGASLYLLNIFGHKIQIESGVRPRVKWTPGTYCDALPSVLNKNIEALCGVRDIVITHGHLDHVGALVLQFLKMRAAMPWLQPEQLRIWMTKPTWRFLEHQTKQTVFSMTRNPEWKVHEPLFTEHDIAQLKDYVRIVEFGEAVELNRNLTMIPMPAGHILGAASFLFCQKLQNGGEARVFATGDTSDKDQFFIKGATRVWLPVDFLLAEGTNLGKVLDPLEPPVEGFLESDSFSGTLNRGGIVVVPSLTIHRMPDNIARIRTAGLERVAPLCIDGGKRALEIFQECLLPEKRSILGGLKFIHGKNERQEILRSRRAIVIAAGGMFPERSPAHWWLTHGVEHPDVSFVINNWQDPCSPGTSLLAHRHHAGDDCGNASDNETLGQNTIQIGEEEYQVRCEVHRLATSSHQEEGEFEQMVGMLAPKRTAIVHAEFHQAEQFLSGKSRQQFIYPEHGKEVGI